MWYLVNLSLSSLHNTLLIIFSVLKSALSEAVFFWLVSAQFSIPLLLIYLCILSKVGFFCRQHIVGIFKIYFNNLSYNLCVYAVDILSDYWYSWINIYNVCNSFYSLHSSLFFLSFSALSGFQWTFYIILSPFLPYQLYFFKISLEVAVEFAIYIYNWSNPAFKSDIITSWYCRYLLTGYSQFFSPILYNIAVIHFTFPCVIITQNIVAVIALNK